MMRCPMNLRFRLATELDLPKIKRIIGEAQAKLRKEHVDQWQNGYPTDDILRKDITNENRFVMIDAEDRLLGSFTLVVGDDPNYEVIKGAWKSDNPYVVLHRLAIASSFQKLGLARTCLSFVEQKAKSYSIRSFRVDTHEDNLPMRRLLKSVGFTYCGIISVADGTPRRAYEKELG